MEFKREILVNKPIADVWEVLGNQYGEAYKWARTLNHSAGFGTPKIEGAVCNNRTCDTTQGRIKEVVKTFDAKNYILAYEVEEGFPFFIGTAINTWRLTQRGNATQVNMHLRMETKGLVGSIMSPMMKLQLNKLLTDVIGDFKHYVEIGKPSPEKAEELAKFQRKTKKAA